MRRRFGRGDIAQGPAGAEVVDVRGTAAGVPLHNQAGPAMVMHGDSLAGRRDIDFEDADEGIFEEELVALGRGQQGIEAIGEIGGVLAIEVEVSAEQEDRTEDRGGKNRPLLRERRAEVARHGTQYSAG